MKLPTPTPADLQGYLRGELATDQSDLVEQAIQARPDLWRLIEQLDPLASPLAKRLQEAVPAAPYVAEAQLRHAADLAMLAWRESDTVSRTDARESTSNPSLHGDLVRPLPLPPRLREYELLERIGAGGMGAVYKALHTRLGKIVALKVLPPERMRDAAVIARFDREMKAAGGIEHPNVVRATDAGEVDGVHFLVMEHVEGCTVSQLLAERGPLPVAEACEIARQTCLGLQRIHEAGLVHRDVKPANLMLTPQGQVKLLDLGLARWKESLAEHDLTTDSVGLGTIDYLAPEQAANARQADIRADLYSLGCTLYKLLSGQTPFTAGQFPSPAAQLLAHATLAPPPIRQLRGDVPPELETILRKLLAKNPADRFSTPRDLAEALEPWSAAPSSAAARSSPLPLPEELLALSTKPLDKPRRPARPRWPLAALAAAVLAVCGAIIVLQFSGQEYTITLDDPSAQLKVDGRSVVIDGEGIGKLRLMAGEHSYTVERGGVLVKGPETFEVRRKGERQLKIEVASQRKAAPKATAPPATAPPERESPATGDLDAAPALSLAGFAERKTLTPGDASLNEWQRKADFLKLKGAGWIQYPELDAKRYTLKFRLEPLKAGKLAIVLGDVSDWHPELHFERLGEEKEPKIRVRLLRRSRGKWFFPGDTIVRADIPHDMTLTVEPGKTTLSEGDRELKSVPASGAPRLRIESDDPRLEAVISRCELRRLDE